MVSDRSQGGRNESRHTNFENLKIEVQFDHSSGGGQSNQYESGRQQASLGNHKRDNFQGSRPPLRKPNEKVLLRSAMSQYIFGFMLYYHSCVTTSIF